MPDCFEDVIFQTNQISQLCREGDQLCITTEFVYNVYEQHQTCAIQSGYETLLRNLDFFSYLPNGRYVPGSPENYNIAFESILSTVFKATVNFFSRLLTGIKTFINKIFTVQKNISEHNKAEVAKAKKLLNKYSSDLGKVHLSESVPPYKELLKVLSTMKELMSDLCKFPIHELNASVANVLDGNSNTVTFEINYSKLLGSNYIEKLSSIGIEFDEDDSPIFSTTLDTSYGSERSISELGYHAHELEELVDLTTIQISSMHDQLFKIQKILESIVFKITKLQNTNTDLTKEENYKEVFATLPKEVSKLVGIYHKITSAKLAYTYVVTSVISSIIEALEHHDKSN